MEAAWVTSHHHRHLHAALLCKMIEYWDLQAGRWEIPCSEKMKWKKKCGLSYSCSVALMNNYGVTHECLTQISLFMSSHFY